ncbi:hypothetical protein MKK70_21320 [Methylobacterium sp. E-041]|uniref:hypothetical protein n=1 Tax=Methylobacterium sp. E-041 TaxID=2836573 RepID=UPI001FBB028F|nr:hypothetical protein [Methylobacterium sp. E-041]MCJ2107870.1 hypothetical protein [Methylobacterium sp. E-041]
MSVEKFTSIALLILAFAASIVTLILAFKERNSSASISAAFAVVLFLLTSLPNIEFFKGWGVETRIREQVNRAENALENIKLLTATFSKQAYTWLSYVGRIDSPTWEERFSLSRDITSAIEKTGVNDPQLIEAKHNFDRFFVISVARLYLGFRNDRLRKSVEYTQHGQTDQAEKMGLLLSSISISNFKYTLKNDPDAKYLDQADRDKLNVFIDKLGDEMVKSLSQAKPTPFLNSVIDQYGQGLNGAYSDVFGEKPISDIY